MVATWHHVKDYQRFLSIDKAKIVGTIPQLINQQTVIYYTLLFAQCMYLHQLKCDCVNAITLTKITLEDFLVVQFLRFEISKTRVNSAC